MKQPGQDIDKRALRFRLFGDLWDLARAASPTHLHLRNRLLTVILLSVVIDLAASGTILVVEGAAPGSNIAGFWDAFYWTTSQLLTISSTMANPVTTAGQALCLLLDLYAITVVSTLAGMFSAFFYRRGEERDPVRGGRP
ncbi:hypothetical protein [Halomonas organivorans]|uniref:Potassium channel domain-containing protein n=1 Tax=Halomonas organivorans TaxID=257772 RepID=A0A7W5BXD1_9GAMM|nr:hypothetical protein [Halomonas organivorans]MBB3140922.1 hypothetical protein [Halomonas organivorans]